MNKTIKILLSLSIIIVVLAITTMNSKEESISPEKVSVEKTDIKIANLPIVQGLPIYLAIEKGYFSEAGINVEIIKFQSPNQIVDALLTGQVDLVSPSGAMGIIGIANAKNPGKLKIYAAAGGDTIIQNDSILIKNNSSIKDLSDLKGKKIGTLPGIQWRTITKHILSKNNLVDGVDVTIVELAPGSQAPALASGEIDALLGVEPIPTIIKLKKIGKELVDKTTTEYVSNPFYGGAGAITTSFATKNPKTTKKILSIIKRSINEITNNPDEARQYLKNYTPLNDAAIAEVPISNIKMYDDFTQNDIGAVQKFYDIFLEHNVVKEKMNFTELIYKD